MLMIVPKTKGIGGVAQHVSKLISKLTDMGYEVDCISCETYPCLGMKGLSNPSFMISSSLLSIISRPRYDIVHAHNIPSALAMRFVKARKILTLHGTFSEQIAYLYGSMMGKAAELLELMALKWADRITAVSKSATIFYKKKGVDVVHIPNAVDLSDMPEEELRFFDRQIIYIGRLSMEKGLDTLLLAFRKVENAHLLIIGDGPIRTMLENFAKRDERIHILGYRPRKEALKILKGSDVFVLPSRYEGLSTALLEAMALKVPVVATKVGGNVELVNKNTGILVDAWDHSSMAKAINMLLNDREKAMNLAENAYRTIIDIYNWDKIIHQYISVYEEKNK
ncbi:glycosyltransferase family 4 protein [Candidatus Methanodesulfokora washburnensis]|nr:glycosyltransferase family 4 protein [Candidatus Methanodesulfokores washburnensis]